MPLRQLPTLMQSNQRDGWTRVQRQYQTQIPQSQRIGQLNRPIKSVLGLLIPAMFKHRDNEEDGEWEAPEIRKLN